VDLIRKINSETNNSIKVKFKNERLKKIILSKFKKLKGWKPQFNIEKNIINEFKNENY